VAEFASVRDGLPELADRKPYVIGLEALLTVGVRKVASSHEDRAAGGFEFRSWLGIHPLAGFHDGDSAPEFILTLGRHPLLCGFYRSPGGQVPWSGVNSMEFSQPR
jgi:hypothetical protein